MNTKLVAIISVVVLATAGVGGWYYYTHSNPEFGWEYNDCYLDITDAESILLKNRPTESNVLGMNVEVSYGGNTLYKRVAGVATPQMVDMYRLDDEGEKEDVEIDRDILKIVELDENAFAIVYYGKPSDANSHELYQAGYKYDPNCQLSYIVDNETGKMHNITQYTREIVYHGTNSVSDMQYPMVYVGVEDGKYKFMQDRHNTAILDENGNVQFEENGNVVCISHVRFVWFEIDGEDMTVTEGEEGVDRMLYADPSIYPRF